MNSNEIRPQNLIDFYYRFQNFSKSKPIPISKFPKFISPNNSNRYFKNNLRYEFNSSQKVLLPKPRTKIKNLTKRNHVRSTINSNNIKPENDIYNTIYNRNHNMTQNLSNCNGTYMSHFKNKQKTFLFKECSNIKTQEKKIPSYKKRINKKFLPVNFSTGFYIFNSSTKNSNKKLKSISIKPCNNSTSTIPLIKNKIDNDINKKIYLSKSCTNIKNKLRTIKNNRSLDNLKTNYAIKNDKSKFNKILINNFITNSISLNLVIKQNISTNRILPFKSNLPHKKIRHDILLLTTSPKNKLKTKICIKKNTKKEKILNDEFVLESNREFATNNNEINSIKINEFNVNKPNDENLKYTLFKSESEKSSTRPSKIVIGNIEGYKDIIESDKLNYQIEEKKKNDEIMAYNEKSKPNKIWKQEKCINLDDIIDDNNINLNMKKNTILTSYKNFNNRVINKRKEKIEDLYKKDGNYIDSLTIINNNETIDDYKAEKNCIIF